VQPVHPVTIVLMVAKWLFYFISLYCIAENSWQAASLFALLALYFQGELRAAGK
jgi:hypothetical protein